MEKIMNQILERLGLIEKMADKINFIEKKVARIDGIEKRLDRLEPMVEESHQWIRALIENKDVHRAEMDSIKNSKRLNRSWF